MSYEHIRTCILRCGTAVLTGNVLDLLIQLKKLAELKCSSDELTEAEQFAACVADVKRLVPRLRSLAFREHYAEALAELKPDIVSGTAACEEVKSSEKFSNILQLLLLLGNYMNTGSNNAGAYGFEISFLTKVLETIESKFPDALAFAEEMPHVDRAARVSMESLQKALKKMDNDIRALEMDLTNSRVPQAADDLFHDTMNEARSQCDLLHSMYKKMEALYSELAEYYCFDPLKYTLDEFFSDIKTFKDSFMFAKEARSQCDLLHSMYKKMEALYSERAEYYCFDPLKYTLDEFFSDMKTFKDSFVFAKEARSQCDLLHSMYKKMEALYSELAEYYCFDPLKYTLDKFFSDIKTFKDSFMAALQENVVARETEVRAKRAKEARAQAEKDKRERQHRYKQFVDMESAQEGVMDSLSLLFNFKFKF
ncbi:putative diaphanous [Operophtera brumata]|uniref:Putative diaphanous n=1 Tax=Operophtera brumata TaxID=104452 RepID=A0A0L7L9K9_OPEBR|nr:putative diaphanous [Operophtera brumata]